MRKAHDDFSEILQRLAMDETTGVEARDGALMTARFLKAIDEDARSSEPEKMTATTALLQEFDEIVPGSKAGTA